MPDLLIRDVDDALHARLKARATSHGRSLGVEARETLRCALARTDLDAQEDIVTVFTRLFGPENGVDLDLPPRGTEPERPPVDFSGPEFDP